MQRKKGNDTPPEFGRVKEPARYNTTLADILKLEPNKHYHLVEKADHRNHFKSPKTEYYINNAGELRVIPIPGHIAGQYDLSTNALGHFEFIPVPKDSKEILTYIDEEIAKAVKDASECNCCVDQDFLRFERSILERVKQFIIG